MDSVESIFESTPYDANSPIGKFYTQLKSVFMDYGKLEVLSLYQLEPYRYPTQLRVYLRQKGTLGEVLRVYEALDNGETFHVICVKRYFNRHKGGEQVSVWCVWFHYTAVEAQDEIIQTIRKARAEPTYYEVTEIPLPGARADRNAHKRGKGAGLSGHVAVGAAAITGVHR